MHRCVCVCAWYAEGGVWVKVNVIVTGWEGR